MENKVFLNIYTQRGLIVIPFEKLRYLDLFTMGYDNETEFIESINRILDLSLDISEVISIYISGRRFKHTKNDSLSCIKYSSDNYNLDSLKEMLALYLKQNHKRIRYCDVRFVNTEGMIDFNAGLPISDKDIDLAVSIYLNSGYKKQRDMYFMIKNFGTVRIDKLSEDSRKRESLPQMDAKEDSFVKYFIELSSRGEEQLEKALDELSKVDLEEISKVLDGTKYIPFDGIMETKEDIDYEESRILSTLTGLGIDEIKELQIGYQGYKYGRIR